jgi:hypothetical protein
MSSSNRGLLAVLGIGIAAGLGFALYYVFVVGPAGERDAMQQQIRDWAEQKWLPLRRCLLGDAPMVQNGRDALVLRQATDPSPVEAGACAPLMADLARPPGPSSGLAEVETGWKDVRVGAALLSNRYAGASLDSAFVAGEVGEAIEKLDATYAKLRHDAGMEPDPPPGAESIAELPAGVELPDINPARQPLAVLVEPTGIRLETRGSRVSMAAIRGPGAVEIRRGQAGLPAVGGDWEAWVEAGDDGYALFAGDPRATGRAPIHQLGWSRGEVVYAAQDGDRRLIAVEVPMGMGDALLLVEGGADGWSPRLLGDLTWSARTASGRLDLFVDLAPGTGWIALGPRGVAVPEPVRLPGRGGRAHCPTPNGLWYVDDNQFLVRLEREAAPARAPAPEGATRVAGCAADRVVFRTVAGDSLQDCTLASCDRRFRFGDGLRVGPVGAVDGTLRFVGRVADDLLLYWDGPKATPRPLRLPAGAIELHALARIDGVTQLLFTAGGSLRLAPLP